MLCYLTRSTTVAEKGAFVTEFQEPQLPSGFKAFEVRLKFLEFSRQDALVRGNNLGLASSDAGAILERAWALPKTKVRPFLW